MQFLCLLSIKPVRKSLTLYGSQNPKFYYITVALSMQEKSCILQLYLTLLHNMEFELHPAFLLKHTQIHPSCPSVHHTHVPQCSRIIISIGALCKKLEMSIKFKILYLFISGSNNPKFGVPLHSEPSCFRCKFTAIQKSKQISKKLDSGNRHIYRGVNWPAHFHRMLPS